MTRWGSVRKKGFPRNENKMRQVKGITRACSTAEKRRDAVFNMYAQLIGTDSMRAVCMQKDGSQSKLTMYEADERKELMRHVEKEDGAHDKAPKNTQHALDSMYLILKPPIRCIFF